jgi:hypothetical protein
MARKGAPSYTSITQITFKYSAKKTESCYLEYNKKN